MPEGNPCIILVPQKVTGWSFWGMILPMSSMAFEDPIERGIM